MRNGKEMIPRSSTESTPQKMRRAYSAAIFLEGIRQLNLSNIQWQSKTGERKFVGLENGYDGEIDRMKQRDLPRYGSVAQAFHWITAILVVIAFIYGPGGSEQRVYSEARDFDRQLHETLGISVFALVVMRLIWRTVDERPDPPQVSRWMGIVANAAQWGLYLLLFALPLTAVAGAWLEGHPLTLVAGIEIPSLFRVSHDVGAQIATLHTWLGDAILWLAGFHALAALYHHIVLKDGVLVSMLPRWFPLRQTKL
jgi:cytochrome b561